jgi:signal transduction histidine kinase
VRGLDKLLGRLLGGDIQLTNLIAPDLGWVMADPNQLEQVLVNLAINARDAMPHGGTLTIAATNVALSVVQAGLIAGEYVLLTAQDTGVGMDAVTLARMFEPFFTTKSREHNTGLGLSTCSRIVTQSGGDISITSALGQGTTINIYLPRAMMSDTDAAAMPQVINKLPCGPAGSSQGNC